MDRSSTNTPTWSDDELTRIEAAQELEIAYDAVDAGYRAKYGRYASIVDGITDDPARSTTLRLDPRAPGDTETTRSMS